MVGFYVVHLFLILMVTIFIGYSDSDVRLPPHFTAQPQSVVYRSGARVNMTCEAHGIPEIRDFSWTKNGMDFSLNRENIVSPRCTGSTGTFIFDPATTLDAGYYQCFAKNDFGKAMSNVAILERAKLVPFPPSPTQVYTVSQGSKLKVFCQQTLGLPKPKYSWQVKESLEDRSPQQVMLDKRIQIDDNGNLYFANVELHDQQGSKIYICLAYNPVLDLTTGGSPSRIIVSPGSPALSRPVAEYTPQAQEIALVGRELRLRCLFSGFPTPNVNWNRVGTSLPVGHYTIEEFGTVLVIHEIRESDEGEYKCTGANRVDIEDFTVTVDVQAVPLFEDEKHRPHNIIKSEGESVSFICNAKAEPESYVQWYKNGEPIYSGPRMTFSDDKKNLTIIKLSKAMDLMVIQCNSSNVHGYAYAEGYLNVILRTELTIKPSNVSMKSWDEREIFFPCEATSEDATPFEIIWLHNDVQIDTSNLGFDQKADGLTVFPSVLENIEEGSSEGKYTCVASNGFTYDNADAYLTIPEAEIKLPPHIIAQPLSQVFHSGTSVTLTCEAHGIPYVEYSWQKNGLDFSLNKDNIVAKGESGTFQFRPATALDPGYYQCFAKNLYGIAMSQVAVLERARLQPFPAVPTQEYTVSQGSKLKITCMPIMSYPPAQYSWVVADSYEDRSPQEVHTDKRIQIDDDGNLYFANVEMSDQQGSKIYLCAAFNPVLLLTTTGSPSRIFVTPGSPASTTPMVQFAPQSTEIALMGGELRLRCIFSGFPTPNVRWSRVGGSLPVGRYTTEDFGTVLVIQDVQESDEGEYKCIGTNTVDSEDFTINVDVQAAPMFEDENHRPHNMNRTEGASASFICDAKADPEPEIQWYKNGEPMESGPRMIISADKKNLTVINLNKDLDLMVIQCNASNVHGYAYAEGYLNVLSANQCEIDSDVSRILTEFQERLESVQEQLRNTMIQVQNIMQDLYNFQQEHTK